MSTKKKYPKQFFEHYLAMFQVNFDKWDKNNLAHQAILYKTIEGDEAFAELMDEITSIEANNDIGLFVDYAVKIGLRYIDEAHIKQLIAITREVAER